MSTLNISVNIQGNDAACQSTVSPNLAYVHMSHHTYAWVLLDITAAI